jgi:F-type H+-transporting ATPase subunit b
MELLKLLSASELVAQIVTFLLLLGILRVFFWRRILKILDDRKTRIASEFKNIEEAKKEIAGLKSDYEAKLSSIEEIARAKIQEAEGLSLEAASQIKKEANLTAQKIIDSAKADIKYEVAKAKDELKNQIVELTINAAEGLIGEKLDRESDKKLVEEFIKEVDKKE